MLSAVAIVLIASGIASSEEPGSQAVPAAGPPSPSGDGRRTMGRLPANLGRSLIGVFSRDNLVPVVVGGVAAGGSSFADGRVRDAVAEPGSGFGKALETGGGALWSTVFVTGMFTAGRLTQGRFRAMSYDMLDAVIVNVGCTQLVKVGVGHERPRGQNRKSFPPGHASYAFVLATVAERHYGWKAGVPALALASAMGYSRLVRDEHYLSDVVAGATLGLIIGRTTVRVNSRPLPTTPPRVTWSVAPVLSQQARGLAVRVVF